jgi:tRNA pseudouridine65 synthase
VLEVLYRDDDVVAVHKPPGLMVHRSDLDRRETRFAVQLLRAQLGRDVFPAHRLDRGTSGVLLFAFDSRTAARLGQAFESRVVEKRYLVVVRGWPEPAGVIDHPLRRLEDGKDVGDNHAPRQDARTDYRRLACAEVPIPRSPRQYARRARRASPHTGQRHQVRATSAHLPAVIGDATYGRALNRAFAGHFRTSRLLLACVELSRPRTDALRLHAPLESGFASLCTKLGWVAALTAGRIGA